MKSKIEEKEEIVINLLKEGKTFYEIAEAIGDGISSSALRAYSSKRGFSKYRPPEKTWINWEEKKDELRKLYFEDNLSQEEIGKYFRVSQRTISSVLKKFGFIKNPSRKPQRKSLNKKKSSKIKQKRCPVCGKLFISNNKGQIYCSMSCFYKDKRKSNSIDSDKLKETLNNSDWNYTKTAEILGTTRLTIRTWVKKFGLTRPGSTSSFYGSKWSDLIDLESVQKKVDELGVKSKADLYKNYRGLYEKIKRMKLLRQIKYPKSDFDSSWEEQLYSFIEKSNISYSSLKHNYIIDYENCRYINPLSFDIVLEYSDSTKVAIEIQGPTHFKNVYEDKFEEVRKRDEIKYEYCISHNIDLYYFTYDQSLLDTYGYPHYVYTDENLLLEKLITYSLPSL